MKKRILTGITTTGTPHIGNYLGAIKNFVDLQNKFECVYCIVDLHAITNRQDPTQLKSNKFPHPDVVHWGLIHSPTQRLYCLAIDFSFCCGFPR